MHITGSKHREQVAEWAIRVQELIASRSPDAVSAIATAIEQFRQDRFLLTVLGKAKRGKSTLINALLGRGDDLLAPIDRLPASNALTRFVWAEQPYATVYFHAPNAQSRGSVENIPWPRIREFVTEEENPGNGKQVEAVEVGGPFEGFDQDLVLVDTPGAGSIHQYHDALLHGFIPQSDAVIFLVTARMPIDDDELELLRKIRAADIRKVFFVINKVDQSSPQDLEDAITHNASRLAHVGIDVDGLHRLSAKQAFEGKIPESGLPELVTAIQTTIRQGKAELLASRFIARVRDWGQTVLTGLDLEVGSFHKSGQQLETEQHKLAETRDTLLARRKGAESRFLNRWNRVLDQFSDQLPQLREAVTQSLSSLIDATPLTGISRLAKQLPSLLVQEIESQLHPQTESLEQSLAEACRELQEEYPRLNWSTASGVPALPRGSAALSWSAAGGLAAAAAGAGMVVAAQAATAAAVQTFATPSLIGALLLKYTGTASVFWTTVSVPATVPLWVAAAGPIGWTLAGLGALAIPFAWSLSRSQQRGKLQEQCDQCVRESFEHLLQERIPVLRSTAHRIVEEFQLRLDQELAQIEQSLKKLSIAPLSATEIAAVRELRDKLHAALEAPPGK